MGSRTKGAGNSTHIRPTRPAFVRDLNVEVAGLLLDMSALQKTKPSGLGYKRAAYAVFSLERSVDELVASGTLQSVRGIGPSSERIIREWVTDGTASRVEAAMAQASAPVQADIAKRRAVRDGSFVRVARCGWYEHGGGHQAARADRPAERTVRGRVHHLQRYRGQHPCRRAGRHGARGATGIRTGDCVTPLRAAKNGGPDGQDDRGGADAWRPHARSSARPALQQPAGGACRLGESLQSRGTRAGGH